MMLNSLEVSPKYNIFLRLTDADYDSVRLIKCYSSELISYALVDIFCNVQSTTDHF